MSQPSYITKSATLNTDVLELTAGDANSNANVINGNYRFTNTVLVNNLQTASFSLTGTSTTLSASHIIGTTDVATPTLNATTGNIVTINSTDVNVVNNVTAQNNIHSASGSVSGPLGDFGIVHVATSGSIDFPVEAYQPLASPLEINGTVSGAGTLIFSQTQKAATIARTDANAVLVCVDKFGHFMRVDIQSTGLGTSSNALFAGPIQIVGAIPGDYCPVTNQRIPCFVEDNAARVAGECSILTTGDIVITVGSTGASFTIGANCAFYGASCIYAV